MTIRVAIKIRVYLKGKMLLLDHRVSYLEKICKYSKICCIQKDISKKISNLITRCTILHECEQHLL